MTTRKRVQILTDIIANQVGVFLPNSERYDLVQEAMRLLTEHFRANSKIQSMSRKRELSAIHELTQIEAALFHITGGLRKYIRQNCRHSE